MQTMFDDENRQENEFAYSRLHGEKEEEFEEELVDNDEEEEDENRVEDQEEEGERGGEEEKIGIDADDVDPDPWNTISYVIP